MGASNYGWIISHDSIAEPGEPAGTYQNAKGLTGPHNVSADRERLLRDAVKRGRKHALPDDKWFQMFDDDGEKYYTGVYLGPDDEDMFGPIDDFGTPNAGCTEIRYYDGTDSNGQEVWTTL